ncbi:MAG: GGDEF domain-containing protein [Marinobacter sp.]|uniref:GGDEF domain-containing protein n=1 Tax=Marinobacter sp. TaxID=50741 RepID=UPI00396D1AAA
MVNEQVPERRNATLGEYQEHIEARLAIYSAWVLLTALVIYHAFHLGFNGGELTSIEIYLRAPVVAFVLLTVIARSTGFPRWPTRYLLKLTGISLIFLVLAQLYIYASNVPGMLNQVPQGLILGFFVASILSLRSFQDWVLIILVPVLAMALIAWIGNSLSVELAAILLGPLMISLINCLLITFIQRVTIENFKNYELAINDPLTQLLNRRAFLPLFHHDHSRAERSQKPLSVVIADLDDFKQVNDTWGHNAGDQALREVARRLKDCLRKQDVVCRWGGEEFLILLPETDSNGAMRVAEKCRSSVSETLIDIMGHGHTQTISLGVATLTGGESVEELINRADRALYSAKKSGRNRVELARVTAAPSSQKADNIPDIKSFP